MSTTKIVLAHALSNYRATSFNALKNISTVKALVDTTLVIPVNRPATKKKAMLNSEDAKETVK